MASLFEELFNIHKNITSSFYYKEVVSIFSHPFIKPLFYTDNLNFSQRIIEYIQNNNIVLISIEKLKTLAAEKSDLISIIFESWQDDPNKAIEQCSKLILKIKECLDIEKSINLLALEYLFRFNEIFNELGLLNASYHHIRYNKHLIEPI